MVGIVTFDSSVHFFNVAKGQAMPQMLVMPDVNDVYAPMSSQLLAKLSDCREQLQELLGSIPGMFAAATGPECCATAAIQVSTWVHSVDYMKQCCHFPSVPSTDHNATGDCC